MSLEHFRYWMRYRRTLHNEYLSFLAWHYLEHTPNQKLIPSAKGGCPFSPGSYW